MTQKGLKKRCVLRASSACRLPTFVLSSRADAEANLRELGPPGCHHMEGAAGTNKRNHEELSHSLALVEAARKVRASTARPCAHGQMGSQCGRRERLRPSSADVSLDVTSVANAYSASRRRERVLHRLKRLGSWHARDQLAGKPHAMNTLPCCACFMP